MSQQVDYKQKLSKNMDFLKRNTMRVNMLVSELVSCDLLTFNQADEIRIQPNHLQMHEKLYTFLMENSTNWEDETRTMNKLKKAFRTTRNSHLVEILEK